MHSVGDTIWRKSFEVYDTDSRSCNGSSSTVFREIDGSDGDFKTVVDRELLTTV